MMFNPRVAAQKIRGLAKPELFAIVIPRGWNDYEDLTLLATSTTMPGRNLEQVEYQIQGLTIKEADRATFEDWTVTFKARRDHAIRNAFLKWNAICHNVSSGTKALPAEYKVDDAMVYQLSEKGAVVSAAKFVGLWPKTIGEITLGHAESPPEEYDLTFTYDYHQMGDAGGDFRVDINIDAGGIMAGAGVSFGPGATLGSYGSVTLGV